MTRWRLTECRIAGAMTTWSGAAAFDRAPLVLSSSEHPDQVLVVRRYADGDDGGAAAEGLLTSSAEWDGLIQSGNAMALDHRPAAFRGAWLWLFRPNWPLTRDLAIEALKAEGHLPDQPIQGEADVLGCLVDDTRTDGLRDAWANRLADEARRSVEALDWPEVERFALAAFQVEPTMPAARLALVVLALRGQGRDVRGDGYLAMAAASEGATFVRETHTELKRLEVDHGGSARKAPSPAMKVRWRETLGRPPGVRGSPRKAA